jgi:HlyD family secretion protein
VRSRETRSVAAAVVAQRESEARLARTELARVKALFERTVASQQRLDEAQTKNDAAAAGLVAAREEVHSADASIAAAEANIARIQTDIDDSALAAPVSGRVLYRLAEPGEVLAAGGKVVTLLDLTDVFMTIFLSMAEAGRVRLASEARVVLDPIPEYVIPGSVSFVSPEAQFTPKEVETRSEREMLMFRIKVKLDPAVLEQHLEKVKTGVPGIAYVRLGPEMPDWPPELQVRLPE